MKAAELRVTIEAMDEAGKVIGTRVVLAEPGELGLMGDIEQEIDALGEELGGEDDEEDDDGPECFTHARAE